jgi:hypothetical protein
MDLIFTAGYVCYRKEMSFLMSEVSDLTCLGSCAYYSYAVLLGAFAKLRRATANFVMPTSAPAHMEQLGFHCTDFHEIGYLSTFVKLVSLESA